MCPNLYNKNYRMQLSKIILLFLFIVNINANSVNSGHAEISLIKYNQSELSNDKSCSWMEVECLGACVNAPMMQINDDYYEDLDKEKTLKILDKILSGEKPIPGSYRGRINNEPENNRKTLMDLKNA